MDETEQGQYQCGDVQLSIDGGYKRDSRMRASWSYTVTLNGETIADGYITLNSNKDAEAVAIRVLQIMLRAETESQREHWNILITPDELQAHIKYEGDLDEAIAQDEWEYLTLELTEVWEPEAVPQD